MAEAARAQLSSRDSAVAMTTFDDEWDNLRAAFEWQAATDDVDAVLRLVIATYWFAELSHRYELLPWAERAVALDGARHHHLWPAAAGVTVLLRQGTGDWSGAEALAAHVRTVEATEGLRPRSEPVLALVQVYMDSGRYEETQQILPAAETIAEREMDPLELGHIRCRRVMMAFISGGDTSDCVRLAASDIRDAEATGNAHYLAWAYLAQLAVASVASDTPLVSESFSRAMHWAEIATNRSVLANAPLWIAHAARDGDPKQVLTPVRGVLISFYDAGFWAWLDFALSLVIPALIKLGHYRTAALALGAVTETDMVELRVQATADLRRALGPELDQFPPRRAGLSSEAR